MDCEPCGSTASPQTSTGGIVCVVDDDVSVRESLELLIQEAGWQPVLFASAREFLNQPAPAGPSCLVLDVHLPDLNGLELQQRMAADGVAMPIIFITGQGDVPTTVRAIKAGALEFLTKPLSSESVLSAIGEALSHSRAALLEETELRALRAAYATLSRREREVMELVISGMLNKHVGNQLGISEITVKAHRGQVMRKMKARTFVELVKMNARLVREPS